MKKLLTLTIITIIALIGLSVSVNAALPEKATVTTAEQFIEAVDSGKEITIDKDITVKLEKDITITEKVTIGTYYNSTFTLDLNGHTVKLNSSNSQIYVQSKGTLIIKDSVDTGLITNAGATSYNQYLMHVKGNLQIDGGTLENTFANGKTVYIQDTTSTCTLNSGTIRNTWEKSGQPVYVKGTFTMNGGKVENKAAGGDGLVSAIEGQKVIIKGGTIEAAGTGIEATGQSVEITGGTIKAGWFGIYTRYATINPAEGKTVNISAGRAAIIALRMSGTEKGNKIYSGNFDAPVLMESKYACDPTNVEIYGGLFTMEVAKEYVAPGYIINYPVFVDGVEMYEVKQNRPYVTGGDLTGDAGKIEMGVTDSDLQEELERVFEQEIDGNETLKKALEDGKKVNIDVQLERIEEENINGEELEAIKEAVKDGKFAKFYDITLVVKVDGQEIDTISKISNKLKFKVLIPEELLKDGRTFFMYRYHDEDGDGIGEVEKITGELEGENYFTFESDKFSTYALAYEDEETLNPGEGTTGQVPEEDESTPGEGTTEQEPEEDKPTSGEGTTEQQPEEDKPTSGEGTTEQQPEEDKNEDEKIEDDKEDDKKDDTPATGSVDVVLFASAIIATISLVGIALIKKHTK